MTGLTGAGQNPVCHQHHGNSHDRIFGAFGGGEAPAPAREGVPTGGSSNSGSGPAAPRRRRRWVRTRTQHLSHLSLNDDLALGGDNGATLPLPPLGAASGVATENASYGAMSLDGAESSSSLGPASGRYAYRRPDGNPVTGEGYAQSESCDLQATAGKK